MLGRWAPGLRALLAIAFGVLAIIAVGGTSLLAARDAAMQAREDTLVTLRTFAAGMADRLDRGMFERWRDIRILATDPVLGNPNQPVEARRAVLRRVQESYPDYAIVAFIEPSGRVLVDSRRLAEGADASARTIFIRAKQRPVVEDVHDAIVLARLLPRQADGLPPRFIDIAAPVVGGDDDLIGVVAGHLYWQWAEDIGRQMREAVGPVRRVEPMIVSASGNVLLGPEDLQGKPLPLAAAMHGAATWPDGHEYLTASVQTRGYLDYPGLGWTVVVRQPLELATASLSETVGRIALSGLIAALVAMPIGWLMAGWISRPLRALAATSEQAHRLGDDVPFPSGATKAPYKEARVLAGALRRLVGGLRESQHATDLLVREADHRLKNSLQTVAAILALQARRTSDPASRAAFSDAIARVRSVAEVHRALYQTDGLPGDRVDLSTMLRDLCRQHAAAALKPGVEIECDLKGTYLVEGRRALSIGLLVAELVTNAGKHAFPSDQMGTVEVSLSEHEGALELVVADDGVGMTDQKEAESGLGNVLIQRLARQVGGELITTSAPGKGTRVALKMLERQPLSLGASSA